MIPHLPPCPHCGQNGAILILAIHHEGYEEVYDSRGVHEESNQTTYSRRYSRNSCRCGECNKVRRDVKYDQGNIVVV